MNATKGFVASLLLASISLTHADTIVQWNFNSPVPDGSTSTGTLLPSTGAGRAVLIGNTSGSFAAGDTKADPAANDNTAWNTAAYPGQMLSNKTAGVRFEVDTRAYENITLKWSQRHSSTASRYLRLQYTLDGSTFSDAELITMPVDSVFTNFSVDLSTVPGVANNPVFAFQLVSEFESTALGSGTNGYVATGVDAKYGTSGTIRFDMVTISGTRMPGVNTPPHLSDVPAQTLRVRQSTPPVQVTVSDEQDPAGALQLTATSSDHAIIPDSNITVSGTSSVREIRLTALDQPGTCTITLTLTDTGGRSANSTFLVTVLPLNTAPVISQIEFTNALADHAAGPIPFTIGDLETPAPVLTLTGSSGNPLLVSDSNIGFGGNASNRTVTVMPLPGRSGATPITVTVSDGTNTASTTFPVLVTPSPFVLLCDSFDYADGSLLTNSGRFWQHRSGTVGQCEVRNGKLVIEGAAGEDVTAPLLRAPWARSNGTVLYASFRATFLNLPQKAPGYFAHFGSGSNLRARVFAGTTNAAPDQFRLGIANASDEVTTLARDLTTNLPYRVVIRYDIDTATSTLWVDPASEADVAATAVDSQTPVSISAFGFRQDASVGATVLVEDLIAGVNFAAVNPGGTGPAAIPLVYERSADRLVLKWSDARFVLQQTPALGTPFSNVPGASSPFTNQITGTAAFFRLKSSY